VRLAVESYSYMQKNAENFSTPVEISCSFKSYIHTYIHTYMTDSVTTQETSTWACRLSVNRYESVCH
jgi:5-methylcytosine-specific restriction endonuclease McrBC regulatory subunit McrC